MRRRQWQPTPVLLPGKSHGQRKWSVSFSVMSYSLRLHGLYPAKLLCPWNSPGKNTGVGCCFLLQGIFPTQGWNPYFLHCRQILYHPRHQGSFTFQGTVRLKVFIFVFFMYYLCKKYYKPTVLYSTVLYSPLCQLGTQVNFVGLINKLDFGMCFQNRTHSYVGDLVYLSWCICILTWDKFLSQRNSISNGRTSEPSEVRDYSQANIGRDQVPSSMSRRGPYQKQSPVHLEKLVLACPAASYV